MKISWTSLKISIAGARLSHLVQKDKIWDHGSMAEQARILFYLVYKVKATCNLESLKKQCTLSCFQKLKSEIEEEKQPDPLMVPVIKELAIIGVQKGKNNKPDMFSALIKGIFKNGKSYAFKTEWFFIRQGDGWLLSEIRDK
jgi:hypothetical protein